MSRKPRIVGDLEQHHPPAEASILEVAIASRSPEEQRNVIAERLLGLAHGS